LVIYSSLLDLPLHSHGEVCHLGIKTKKNAKYNTKLSYYSSHYPYWKNSCANVMANLGSLNKLPSTRVFIAAKKMDG